MVAVIVTNSKNFFELLLGDARQGAEHTPQLLHELSEAVADPEIKEVLEHGSSFGTGF
jgi:hypothetical protein